jgi:hypothetical protein
MIKRVKIYGERNSGTRFLTQLIKRNVEFINLDKPEYNGGTGWKHGFPRMRYYNNTDEVLFIFIIRDLEPWILSMFNNPYHYIRPQTIEEFVSGNLTIKEPRKDHDVNICKVEKQNIIKLRYIKIKRYLRFYNNVKNAIFINLKDVQDNNAKFLEFLNTKYKLKTALIPVKIEKHTKDPKEKNCNRNYSTVLPQIYYKDDTIEKMVEGLKTEYIYKSNIN